MSTKVKYCNGNQHSSRSGITFSSLTQIIMKHEQVKWHRVVVFPCQERTSVPLYYFILNAKFSELFLLLGLGLHPRDFRPNLSAMTLLASFCLHWGKFKPQVAKHRSMKPWNRIWYEEKKHSTALCSLGLSSGGKQPQFSSTLRDRSHTCLIIMLHLIVCLTVLVSYLTLLVPAKWSWFLGRRTKDE